MQFWGCDMVRQPMSMNNFTSARSKPAARMVPLAIRTGRQDTSEIWRSSDRVALSASPSARVLTFLSAQSQVSLRQS